MRRAPQANVGKLVEGAALDWLKSAIAGALGFIALAVVGVLTSALTGGAVIHWMGGMTKDEARYAFGGLYLEYDSISEIAGQGTNPLNKGQPGCPDQFTKVYVGHLLLALGTTSTGTDVQTTRTGPASLYQCVRSDIASSH